VRTPEPDKLSAELGEAALITPGPGGDIYVSGVDAARRAGIAVHQLTTDRPDLEDVFLELTTGETSIR
jgi:ABC-2 type transport system ATP-binding protein